MDDLDESCDSDTDLEDTDEPGVGMVGCGQLPDVYDKIDRDVVTWSHRIWHIED